MYKHLDAMKHHVAKKEDNLKELYENERRQLMLSLVNEHQDQMAAKAHDANLQVC